MEDENIKIKDGSDDKKYFTIVPNMILHHPSSVDQSLYIQMKRWSGESGYCSQPISYFVKQLGLTRNTIKNSIKSLLELKWIKFFKKIPIETKGGAQMVDCYVLCDLWERNTDFFKKIKEEKNRLEKGGQNNIYQEKNPTKKGGENNTDLSEKGGQNSSEGGQNNTPYKNIVEDVSKNNLFPADNGGEEETKKKKRKKTPKKEDEEEKKEEDKTIIPDLTRDEKRHVQIIGIFVSIKKIKFENKEQQSSFIVRNVKAAKNLVPYSLDRIIKTAEWLRDNTDYDWKLETIGKFIDSDLEKIKPIGSTQNNPFKNIISQINQTK